jgi:hypothetical protein
MIQLGHQPGLHDLVHRSAREGRAAGRQHQDIGEQYLAQRGRRGFQ